MTYVIGDIHGEYDKLLALMKYLPKTAKLVFIGDYIDKGKDSKKVVSYLIRLAKKRKVVFLIGNHEFKLLQAWQGHQQALDYLAEYGFKETLESYLGRKIGRREFKMLMAGDFKKALSCHYKFFEKLKKYYVEKQYLVVHAGLPVKNGRFSLSPLEELVFVRDKYLKTRKRYQKKIVIFGHTAFREIFWDGYKLGIDSGAVYSAKNGFGRLTAVRLDDFTCVDHEGTISVPRLKRTSALGIDRRKWSELKSSKE